MNDEVKAVIYTDEKVRISVDEFGEGVWLHLQGGNASFHTILNRDEAELMLYGLQKILAKEVAA